MMFGRQTFPVWTGLYEKKRGSVIIWELDSNNSDVDRDSSDESNVDKSSDSLSS